MAGHVGVDGRHAVSPVQQVLKNVLEAALIHLLVMVEETAQEQRGKPKGVTSSCALVRKKFVVEI